MARECCWKAVINPRNHVLKVSESTGIVSRPEHACDSLFVNQTKRVSETSLAKVRIVVHTVCNVLVKLLRSKLLSYYLPFVSHLLHACRDKHHREVTAPSVKIYRES